MDYNEFEMPVYYKIYKSKELNDKLTIVCMQLFDEIDYDKNRFFKNEDGDIFTFGTEQEAINWLNNNIKEKYIDPEYLIKNNKEYYK